MPERNPLPGLVRGWDSTTGIPMVCVVPEVLSNHTPLTTLTRISTPVGNGYITNHGKDRLDSIIQAVRFVQRFPFSRKRVQPLGSGMEGRAFKVTLPESNETLVVKRVNRWKVPEVITNAINRLFNFHVTPEVRILNNAALRHISDDMDENDIKIPIRYASFARWMYRWEIMEYAPGENFSRHGKLGLITALHKAMIKFREAVNQRLAAPVRPKKTEYGLTDYSDNHNIIVGPSNDKFWLIDQ